MITPGKRYRLKIETICVLQDGEQSLAVTIPARAIVEIVDVPSDGSSLNARWDGKPCEIFKCDLEERGEELQDVGDRLPF